VDKVDKQNGGLRTSKVLDHTLEEALAYWISPMGKVVEVHKSHAEVVDDDRALFGLSDEYVEEIIRVYGAFFDGGETRKIIFGRLFKEGWIRLRYVPCGSFVSWTIQFDPSVESSQERIASWARSMIALKLRNGNENVRALDATGQWEWGGQVKGTWVSVKDLAEGWHP